MSCTLVNSLIALPHRKINVDNYRNMIQVFVTKFFYAEHDVSGTILQVIECLALLTEIKQEGAKPNPNHCEALQKY